MHKIDGAGATAENQFTAGDPAHGIMPTRITDAWLNAVQGELVGVVEAAGIALEKTNNLQVIAALRKLFSGAVVGELKWFLSAPSQESGYFNLANSSQVLSSANWPELVQFLRALKLQTRTGTSIFNVSNWAISSNVATLTFANTTNEINMLAALAEDQLVHGSFNGWRTVTLASAIGSISAGTYAITAIDAANRTISFAFTAANGSGSVSATIEFYSHRLSSADDPSGTQARHFPVRARTLVSQSDDNEVSTLRRRDRMQQITGNIYMRRRTDGIHAYSSLSGAFTAGADGNSVASLDSGASSQVSSNVVFDSANSPGARTGTTTDPRSLVAVLCIYGGTFIPS